MVGVPAVALLVIQNCGARKLLGRFVDTVFVTVAPVEILVARYVTEDPLGGENITSS